MPVSSCCRKLPQHRGIESLCASAGAPQAKRQAEQEEKKQEAEARKLEEAKRTEEVEKARAEQAAKRKAEEEEKKKEAEARGQDRLCFSPVKMLQPVRKPPLITCHDHERARGARNFSLDLLLQV